MKMDVKTKKLENKYALLIPAFVNLNRPWACESSFLWMKKCQIFVILP